MSLNTWNRARTSTLVRSSASRHGLPLALLLAASMIVKMASWQLIPQIFNDTAGYMVPAISLLDGRGYGVQENGFRTPTYPLFLALILSTQDREPFNNCQDAHRAVCIGRAQQTLQGGHAINVIVAVQIALGLIITSLLYYLGFRLTGNRLVAWLWGAGYALNIATAFWEISLLTETLTTFLVLFSILLTFAAERRGPWVRVALGCVLAFLALDHSLFLVYWALPALYLAVVAYLRESRARWRRAIRVAGSIVAIPIAALLAWSSFNLVVNGVFTPSTLSGYVMAQLVAPAMEAAPPEYEDLAEVYIGYRDQVISETGSHSGAIFRAWRDMMDATGETWSRVSQRLSALSIYLMVKEPGVYWDIVKQGWGRFWDFAFYHYDPVPDGPGRWVLWFTDPMVQGALVGLFWSIPVVAVLMLLAGHAQKTVRALPWSRFTLVLLTVWFAAVLANLTNFQDNSRHRTYTLPLQYGATVWAVWAILDILRRRVQGRPPQAEERKGLKAGNLSQPDPLDT